MTNRSQSSHRSHCYRDNSNDPAEVIVPEQPTMSIEVTIASQVASGLHALVAKRLARAGERKDPPRSGDTYVNKVSGPVYDTVIQIGRVHGDVHGPK